MAQESPKEDFSFGRAVIEKGYATEKQVREALEIQARLRAMGIAPKRLGQILLERNHITREQTEDILSIQKRRESRRKIPGYKILEELGRGGMGTVYRAIQESMNRMVALKVLAPRHARDRSFIERFFREARAVAKLNHENIITGIDVGEAGGEYYFVMEYVEGETVSEMIKREGAIAQEKAVDVVLQIARALEHANRHNLVHRDVKPQNIMITAKGVAKLCDLGLAKTEDPEAHITRMGVSMGTPHYISPEQAKGVDEVDIRSDIYSLGASLYHMVVGEVPFVGASPMVVMTKHVTEEMPFASEKNLQVSEGTSMVIARMVRKKVDDRYQNPSELIVDLERIARGLPPAIAGRRQVSRRPAAESRRAPAGEKGALVAPVPRSRALRRSRRRSYRQRSEPARAGSFYSRGRPAFGPGAGGRGRRDRPYEDAGYGSFGRFASGSRSTTLRAHTHHENVMLGVFLTAVIFVFAFALLMGYVSTGRQIIGKFDFEGHKLRETEHESSHALGRARSFDRANPYEDKEVVAERYREVFTKYPNTIAAREAQKMYEKVMQRRR